MISFIIFLVVALFAVHSWLNYKNSPSTGRLVLAVILTILALPTLLGAVFKIAVWGMIIFVVFAVVSLIVGPSSDKQKG